MIALSPKNTFPFSLDIDARRTVRTSFVCRYPTADQLAEIDRLSNESIGKAEAEEKRLLLEAIKVVLVSMTPGSGPLVFSLDIDAGNLAAQVFVAKGDIKTMSELVDQTDDNSTTGAVAILRKAIGLCLESVPDLQSATISELREITHKSVKLARVAAAKAVEDLDTTDLWDVVNKIFVESRLSEIERKKSALRSAAAAMRRSAL